MKTPMQELREHLQNMVDNGGDMDLLCVIGMIDSQFISKETETLKEAYKQGCRDFSDFDYTSLTVEAYFEGYYGETFKK